MINNLIKIVLTILISVSFSKFSAAQEKGFGIGVMLGQPTGISAKLWISKTSAIDGGAAWNFKDEAMQVHADYIKHLNIFPLVTGKLPVYAGIGVTANVNKKGDEESYGIRVPLGITYFLPTASFDVFVEAVPVYVIRPESKVTLNGNVGVRYFFK